MAWHGPGPSFLVDGVSGRCNFNLLAATETDGIGKRATDEFEVRHASRSSSPYKQPGAAYIQNN